jgi:TPR repeat protein
MYENGLGGLTKDDTQAVSWFRKAAEQGDARAQTNLGIMYQYGRGLTKDDTQAVSWYLKAAEQGNPTAQNNLGTMYVDGHGGLTKDDAQAVLWWRKAAEQGFAPAQTNLGLMYANGNGGLTKDDAEAVSWYRKAAEQGFAPAKNLLNSETADPTPVQDAEAKTRGDYAKGINMMFHWKGMKATAYATNFDGHRPPPQNPLPYDMRGVGNNRLFSMWSNSASAQDLANVFIHSKQSETGGVADMGFAELQFIGADGYCYAAVLPVLGVGELKCQQR